MKGNNSPDGCLAAAKSMANQGVNFAIYPGNNNCYVCIVSGNATAKLMPKQNASTFVGSNILNILAVLAVPGLINATDMNYAALWRDSGLMLALTLMLALFAYGINSRAVITRFEGAVMLMAWMGYNLLLIQQA